VITREPSWLVSSFSLRALESSELFHRVFSGNTEFLPSCPPLAGESCAVAVRSSIRPSATSLKARNGAKRRSPEQRPERSDGRGLCGQGGRFGGSGSGGGAVRTLHFAAAMRSGADVGRKSVSTTDIGGER
jgi:hypothetical protein